ncbi:MAG: Lrp/AsnC ligand binding domain-containing protein [Rhodocyclales bacterium]|nr:Lrp/AsnC ligand binding domain-containing protein [Rhodocyclales bacterium]
MYKLDQIDLDILAALQADGRITNVALARQVGLSPTPCLERVKSLEAAGLIKGYAAQLSPAALGLGLTVFVQICIERTSQAVFDDFRSAVLAIPEIQECHMVAGGYDYLLKVRVPDMAAYRHFLGAVLSGVPGIRETHTYPVMEEVKDSSATPLGHLAPQA